VDPVGHSGLSHQSLGNWSS